MSPFESVPIDHERHPPPAGGRTCGDPSREYLAHLQLMVSLIERAIADPSQGPAVAAWQPRPCRAVLACHQRGDAASTSYRDEHGDPIVRRAFEALVTGFDRLAAEAAKTLAERNGGHRDIAALLRGLQVLVERAAALIDDDDALATEAGSRRVGRLHAR